jgi:hypothetical protein
LNVLNNDFINDIKFLSEKNRNAIIVTNIDEIYGIGEKS